MFKRIQALVLALFFVVGMVGLSACGSDPCEDAADKIAECLGSGGAPTGSTGDCSGQAECAAECFNAASCDDIKASFIGQLDPTSELFKCSAACTQ
jgi:hypothetical protein